MKASDLWEMEMTAPSHYPGESSQAPVCSVEHQGFQDWEPQQVTVPESKRNTEQSDLDKDLLDMQSELWLFLPAGQRSVSY